MLRRLSAWIRPVDTSHFIPPLARPWKIATDRDQAVAKGRRGAHRALEPVRKVLALMIAPRPLGRCAANDALKVQRWGSRTVSYLTD